MTPAAFHALALRCEKAARECSDLFAKEEFRRLANLFEAQTVSPILPVEQQGLAPIARWSAQSE